MSTQVEKVKERMAAFSAMGDGHPVWKALTETLVEAQYEAVQAAIAPGIEPHERAHRAGQADALMRISQTLADYRNGVMPEEVRAGSY